MESVFDLGRWLAMTPDQQYAHVQRLETAVLNMGQEIERLQAALGVERRAVEDLQRQLAASDAAVRNYFDRYES